MPIIKSYRNMKKRTFVYDPMLREIKTEVIHGPGSSGNKTAKVIAAAGIFLLITGTLLLSGFVN